MNDYYFLYKDALKNWNACINPVFIAKHHYCRAVSKEEIHKLGYDFFVDFIWDLNNPGNSLVDLYPIITEYELY